MLNDSTPKAGFMRLPEVLALYPVSKSNWWKGVQEGRYPAPVRLSARTTAWRVEDIQNLIDDVASQEWQP